MSSPQNAPLQTHARRRHLPILSAVLVLIVGTPGRGQDDSTAKATYPDRAKAVHKRIAKSHYDLGVFCADRKCFKWAIPEFERAVSFDPDNEFARKRLGFRKEKGVWVRDPKVRIDRTNDSADSLDIILATEEQLAKKRADASKRAASDLISLAAWCDKEGLAAESSLHYGEALDYDLQNEKARKALGFTRVGSAWVHPRGKELKAQIEEALKAAPEGEAASEKTAVETALGKTLTKWRTPHLLLQGPLQETTVRRYARLAEAAFSVIVAGLGADIKELGSDYEIVFLSFPVDHMKYVDALVEGTPEVKKMFKEGAGGVLEYKRHEWILIGPSENQEAIVHSVSHFLLGGPATPACKPWMSEGGAFWFSWRFVGTVRGACMPIERSQQLDPASLESPNPATWAQAVRAWVKEGTDPEISGVMGASLDHVTLDQIIKGWSLMDFFLSDPERGKQFAKFLERLWGGEPQDKAIQETFGWSYEELDAHWRDFVRTHY